MANFGIIPEGFNVKTFADIKETIEESQRTAFGQGTNHSATSVISQINNPLINELASLWNVAESIYNSKDPDTATGADLEALAALTGITRLSAQKATVTLTLSLDAATTVPAGSIVSATGNPDIQFVTLADVTSTIADDYDVEAESVLAGELTATGGTLEVIDTPISGWTAVTNAESASGGRNLETDTALRARRIATLSLAGKGTVAAIRADVRAVETVVEANVYENTTDSTVDSIPPHAFEVVVLSNPATGDEDEIAQAIFNSKPIGIRAYGTDDGVAVDEDGEEITVQFTRATEIPLYFDVAITVNNQYPADGDDQVAAAIQTYVEGLELGETIYASQLYASIFSISGVVNITDLFVDDVSTPVTTSVVMTARQIGVLEDIADITVTST